MTCILLSLSVLVWGAFGAGIAYQRIARGVPLPYLIDQMQPVSLALSMAVAVLWTVFVTTVICALLGGVAAAIAYRELVDARTDTPRDMMPTKTLAGQVSISNLPPHRGLTVWLAFFPVVGPGSDAPYNGDPPSDAVTDYSELYSNVDLDNECVETTRNIPFAIKHEAGHYYLQLRTILYRKQDGEVFAQAEQFFFGRRPLDLATDLPSVTLPVEWPSIPLEELGRYGTVKPQKGR